MATLSTHFFLGKKIPEVLFNSTKLVHCFKERGWGEVLSYPYECSDSGAPPPPGSEQTSDCHCEQLYTCLQTCSSFLRMQQQRRSRRSLRPRLQEQDQEEVVGPLASRTSTSLRHTSTARLPTRERTNRTAAGRGQEYGGGAIVSVCRIFPNARGFVCLFLLFVLQII